MACPYFAPTTMATDIVWLHPSRLPLGAGWTGHCAAPHHEGLTPSPEEIKENCNVGYALTCPRLPVVRDCDAVRFSISVDSREVLILWYVLESDHVPCEHGKLEYRIATGNWTSRHSNERIQKMAVWYVQSYFLKKSHARPPLAFASEHPVQAAVDRVRATAADLEIES